MANFELFQCNVCSREIEKAVDQTHASINKCTITYKCTGTLIKISQSDTKTLSGSSIQAGLTNWIPRGTIQPTAPVATIPQVLLNAAYEVLSIAVLESAITSGTNELDMKVEIQTLVNNSYVQYFYNRPSGTTLVTGQDDSSQRLSLRFVNGATPDQVVVYLNGVVLNPSAYDRSVAGRITFIPALTSVANQINVLVYQQAAPSYTTLTFIRNTLASYVANSASAWANISEVQIPNGTPYAVFTCTNVSLLAINSQVIIDSILQSGVALTGPIGYWLVADAPFTSFDRDTLNSISIRDMITNSEVISYKNDILNSPKFYVDGSIIQSMFPPIRISTMIAADVISTAVNDSNTQLINSYIT